MNQSWTQKNFPFQMPEGQSDSLELSPPTSNDVILKIWLQSKTIDLSKWKSRSLAWLDLI